MRVKILSHTMSPEQVISIAAKTCYSKKPACDMNVNEVTKAEADSFINMLVDLGHESPLEHVSFTFAVDNVSRALSHQLVRHRIASYSQKSQRYVSESDFGFVIPPAIENNDQALAKYLATMHNIKMAYNELSKTLIDLGCEEKQAYEDARYVLPNACETSIVFTMNVRSLYNFLSLRTCNRAQWEIRNLANAIHIILMSRFPSIFKNAGPPCMNGKCTEGKMSCGDPWKRSVKK